MSTLPELEIAGLGAVSPAGLGPAALLAEPGPAGGTEALLSRPEKKIAVRRVDRTAEGLARWQQEARLRRASPLALYLVAAAAQALEGVTDVARERIGVVCAVSTGSVVYSRRFYSDILQSGRKAASPALFPETVYNSPVSHLAAVPGLGGAVYTIMGDESAWVEALRVAQVWLARGTADAVVVVGGEELDGAAVEAFYQAGWIRRGAVPSEGAGAVVVRRVTGPGKRMRPAGETCTFRTLAEQRTAWERAAGSAPLPLILPGNVVPEARVAGKWKEVRRTGPDWGAAFTASAAWSTVQVAQSGDAGSLLVPGVNCGVSRIDFQRS